VISIQDALESRKWKPCEFASKEEERNAGLPAQCRYPIFVKDKQSRQWAVPCGSCPNCVKRRANAWKRRIKDHLEFQKKKDLRYTSYLITLTYNDDNVPQELRRKDIQKFLDRLKKKLKKDNKIHNSLNYVYSGEYGDLNDRPHWHLLLMGADINYCYHKFINNYNRNVYKIQDNTNDYIQSLWHYGTVDVRLAYNGAAASYVTGYVAKKLINKFTKKGYLKNDLYPSILQFSQGIAKDFYISKIDEFKEDGTINRQGKKTPIHRYARKLLEKVDEKAAIKLRNKSYEQHIHDIRLKAKARNCRTTDIFEILGKEGEATNRDTIQKLQQKLDSEQIRSKKYHTKPEILRALKEILDNNYAQTEKNLTNIREIDLEILAERLCYKARPPTFEDLFPIMQKK